MIQELIEAYLKRGGKRPYAVLLPVDAYEDVPPDVFVVWTPLITGRVLVTSLVAAVALLNESMQLLLPEKEGEDVEEGEGENA